MKKPSQSSRARPASRRRDAPPRRKRRMARPVGAVAPWPSAVLEAMARARRYVFGRTEEALAARRQAALDAHQRGGQWSSSTGANLLALSLGQPTRAGQPVPGDAVRVVVARKLGRLALAKAGARPIPRTFNRIASDVVARDTAPATATRGAVGLGIGQETAHFVHGLPGSLTAGFEANGSKWLVSCSHVWAPAEVFPSQGDLIYSGGQVVGTLRAWTRLAVGTDGHAVDVAVCCAEPSLALPTKWPDDGAWTGFGELQNAIDPFTLFGARDTGTSGVTDKQLQNVVLGMPDGGAVGYADQFAIDGGNAVIVAPGDSGAAVRDGAGKLVGMVVGMSRDGQVAWCTPWDAIQATVDRIVQQKLAGEIP
jgi:hypothetical protein